MKRPKTTVLSQTLTGGEMTRRIQILFFACWSLLFLSCDCRRCENRLLYRR